MFPFVTQIPSEISVLHFWRDTAVGRDCSWLHLSLCLKALSESPVLYHQACSSYASCELTGSLWNLYMSNSLPQFSAPVLSWLNLYCRISLWCWTLDFCHLVLVVTPTLRKSNKALKIASIEKMKKFQVALIIEFRSVVKVKCLQSYNIASWVPKQFC